MKRQILTALAFCSLGGVAAFAAPMASTATRGSGVVNSPHDMRLLGNTNSEDRVCAFCHTPHHAATSTTPGDYLPLWSRASDVTQFQKAYASSTINAAELQSSDTSDKAIGPTRLCMSCHDGSIAPDQHYAINGSSSPLTGDTFLQGAAVGEAGGSGLTNDHPIGFDYDAVATGPTTGDPTPSNINSASNTTDPWIRNSAALYKNNTLQIKVSDRLYTANGKNYMTCATCHDVHNKKNTYAGTEPYNYLVLAPQANSDLCLSCHIK